MRHPPTRTPPDFRFPAMYLITEGIVYLSGKAVVLFDGKKTSEIIAFSSQYFWCDFCMVGRIALCLCVDGTSRGGELYRCGNIIKEPWVRLGFTHSSLVKLSWAFVSVYDNQPKISHDGLSWTPMKDGSRRMDSVGQALIHPAFHEFTLDGKTWKVIPQGHPLLLLEDVAATSYAGEIRVVEKGVLVHSFPERRHDESFIPFHDTWILFGTEGIYQRRGDGSWHIIPHDFPPESHAVSTGTVVVVQSFTSVYVSTDLQNWTELDYDFSAVQALGKYVVDSMFRLVYSPPWSLKDHYDLLPLHRQKVRRILAAFRRSDVHFPLFLSVMSLAAVMF